MNEGMDIMGDEVTYQRWTRDDVLMAAKTFMVHQYGPPREAPDKERWLERFGMLCHFAMDLCDGTPNSVICLKDDNAGGDA